MKLPTAIDILQDLKEREENALTALMLLQEKHPPTSPRIGSYAYIHRKLEEQYAEIRCMRVSWQEAMGL